MTLECGISETVSVHDNLVYDCFHFGVIRSVAVSCCLSKFYTISSTWTGMQ